jgi:hypothetical protein
MVTGKRFVRCVISPSQPLNQRCKCVGCVGFLAFFGCFSKKIRDTSFYVSVLGRILKGPEGFLTLFGPFSKKLQIPLSIFLCREDNDR